MSNYSGLTTGKNKILIDNEGTPHVSVTDDITNKTEWSKIFTDHNDLFNRLLMGDSVKNKIRSNYKDKKRGILTENTLVAYNNNSLYDTKEGLMAPSEFTHEFSQEAYDTMSELNNHSYMMIAQKNKKTPQALYGINLVSLIDSQYGDKLWSLYLTGDNYSLTDKISILPDIITNIHADFSVKYTTSATLQPYGKDSYLTQVAYADDKTNLDNFGRTYLSIDINSNQSIDDKGYAWFNIHGVPSTDDKYESVSVDYVEFSVDLSLKLSDTYVKKSDINKLATSLKITDQEVNPDEISDGQFIIKY